MNALTKTIAHGLPRNCWYEISLYFDSTFSIQEQSVQGQWLPGWATGYSSSAGFYGSTESIFQGDGNMPLGSKLQMVRGRSSIHLNLAFLFFCFSTRSQAIQPVPAPLCLRSLRCGLVGHSGLAGTVCLAHMYLYNKKNQLYQKSASFIYKLEFSTKNKGREKRIEGRYKKEVRKGGREERREEERGKGEGSFAPLASFPFAPDRLNGHISTFSQPVKQNPYTSSLLPFRCCARLVSHVHTFGSLFKSLMDSNSPSPLGLTTSSLNPSTLSD